MSAGKGGPSNPIGGPAPMPGQPSPGMPAQDPYNRPEATNLPRYAGQPGYPGTGPYTPRPDLGPDVGFGPGLPTPMPMPGIPGGKATTMPFTGLANDILANQAQSQVTPQQTVNAPGFTMPGAPVANQYTRTRTNPGNRFIPSNAPGR